MSKIRLSGETSRLLFTKQTSLKMLAVVHNHLNTWPNYSIIEIVADLTTVFHGDPATLYFLELLKVSFVSIRSVIHSMAKVTCIKPFQIPTLKGKIYNFQNSQKLL